MTFYFSGKVAVVTGAARGIGRATAEGFAQAGADVVMLGRSGRTLAEAQSDMERRELRVRSVVCDVSRAAAVDAAFEDILGREGRVDILVNNAGISGEEAPFLQLSEAAWDEMLAVNLKGPFLLSQKAARSMAAGGGGVILHNASVAGSASTGHSRITAPRKPVCWP